MSNDSEEFAEFLTALRDFRRDDADVRPTAHTASVSTADWRAVEELMKNS